jgi:hypothetical protein
MPDEPRLVAEGPPPGDLAEVPEHLDDPVTLAPAAGPSDGLLRFARMTGSSIARDRTSSPSAT